MKESRILEFKQDITNSFLKTVSAFANFGNGTIVFGVDDHGDAVGIPDPNYFGRCFKKYTGMGYSEYCKQN